MTGPRAPHHGAGTDGPVTVDVEGRALRLTNLSKVLWPSVGMTKADLVTYYVTVAPALLAHIAGHPLTLHRFPDGVDGPDWFETRAPAHPDWVRTHAMASFRSGKDVHAVVVDDLPALVWAANAAAIELHPYLATTDDLHQPTDLVFDLDPGPPADLLDTARVALRLRSELEDLGLESYPKTSGGKGLHVYVPLNSPHDFAATKTFARTVARRLAEHDDHVVDVMTKAHRTGKVFVDWSQNDAGKSTIAPYSLRGLWYPTVSTPVTWDEVATAVTDDDLGQLVFLAEDVPPRLERIGDPFAPVRTRTQSLPA
jgi:bifunctional non-homologous end joining protein LigD